MWGLREESGGDRAIRNMHLDKTDAAVIRASRKDRAAFGVIFDRHWPRIYRYCVERAGPAAGEDVAAETFRVAFTERKRYDGRDDAAPWLYGIATNLLRRWFRAAARGSRAMSRLGSEVSGEELDEIVDGRRIRVERLEAPVRVDGIGGIARLPALVSAPPVEIVQSLGAVAGHHDLIGQLDRNRITRRDGMADRPD